MHNVNINNRPEKPTKEQIAKLIKITQDIINTEIELNKQLGLTNDNTSIEILTDSPNGVMIRISIDDALSDVKQVVEVHKGTIHSHFKDSYTNTLKILKTPRIVSMLNLFSYHVEGNHLYSEVLYGDKETLRKLDLSFLIEDREEKR